MMWSNVTMSRGEIIFALMILAFFLYYTYVEISQ